MTNKIGIGHIYITTGSLLLIGALAWGADTFQDVHISGKLGIGTSAPQAKVQVNDSGNYPTNFKGAGASAIAIAGGIQNNEVARLTFGNGAQGNYAGMGVKVTGSGSEMLFGTSNNYGMGLTNEALKLTPRGAVQVWDGDQHAYVGGGVLHIGLFGGKPDGSNTTPAFNQALAEAKNTKVKAILFGRGVYNFTSAPNDIDFGIDIVGHGRGRTTLIRDYTVSGGGQEGFLTYIAGANGSTVRDLGIQADAGTTGGSAISIIADNSGGPPGFISFVDLILTSGGSTTAPTWDSTIFIDGRARTNDPIGVRDIDFRSCNVFGGTNNAIELQGVVAFNFIGGGIFPAGGASGAVVIGGSTAVNSYYVAFDTGALLGDVVLDDCTYCNIDAAVISGNITNTSNVRRSLVLAPVEGTVQSNWIQSRYLSVP